MLPLSLDLVCSWHFCIFTDLPVACCLSGHLFLHDISLSTSFSDDGTFSWLFPTLFTLLLSSLLFPCSFLLSSVPYSLQFPAFFSYLLFVTSLLSSPLYCLDISIHDCFLEFIHLHLLIVQSSFCVCLFVCLCVCLCVSVCSPSPLHTVAPSAPVCSAPPMPVLVADR